MSPIPQPPRSRAPDWVCCVAGFFPRCSLKHSGMLDRGGRYATLYQRQFLAQPTPADAAVL
jgi:hypothetical protein